MEKNSRPLNWPWLFSCLDIVFFIYLYQRWIYRVDPKRVNEFGTSGEDHNPQLAVTQGGTDAGAPGTHEPPSEGGSLNEGGTGAPSGEEGTATIKTDQEKKDD